ncbi:hypothetical protein ACXJJ3_09315 [Kribbella sp. WER1]
MTSVVGVVSAAGGPTPVIPPKPKGNVELRFVQGVYIWVPKTAITHNEETETPGKPPKKDTHTKPVCEFHGSAQACVDADLGNWSNSHQCYMRQELPPPPLDDFRWQGHTDGSIWACTREQGYDKGKHLVTEWVWLPGKPDTVVVDPVTLAYEAIAAMQLASPVINTAPGTDQVGLVNMPVWMWVTKSENTWGPIVRNASVPGLSVTATGHVKAIDWTMGDGSTVRCGGPGTPYEPSKGTAKSPTCGHTYSKTSQKLPNCKYPVKAVAEWVITWESTQGDAGQINTTKQSTTQIRVAEAVPVLVDPNGGAAEADKDNC